MMMVPYMFNEALMDDLCSNDWEHDFDRAMKAAAPRGMFGKRAANVMKTDVRELENTYELDIDLPGFKKEEVNIELDKGYLTISASEIVDGRARNYYAVTAAGREYLRQTLAEYDEISGVFRQLMEGWDG